MFTLLPELNVICEQRWIHSNPKIVPEKFFICCQNMHCHLANLWNRITTKIFDIFRIITLQWKNFSVRSSPDPPIFKKIAVRSFPDPAKIGFSPDPVWSSPDPCSSLTYRSSFPCLLLIFKLDCYSILLGCSLMFMNTVNVAQYWSGPPMHVSSELSLDTTSPLNNETVPLWHFNAKIAAKQKIRFLLLSGFVTG